VNSSNANRSSRFQRLSAWLLTALVAGSSLVALAQTASATIAIDYVSRHPPGCH